jgi:hypothetical protein
VGALRHLFQLKFGLLTNHFADCSLENQISAVKSGMASEAAYTEAGPDHNNHASLKRLVRACREVTSKVTKLDLEVRPFKLLP